MATHSLEVLQQDLGWRKLDCAFFMNLSAASNLSNIHTKKWKSHLVFVIINGFDVFNIFKGYSCLVSCSIFFELLQ